MHTASRHSGRVREYLASLERDEQVRCAAMEWVDVDEWHTGRVVLIGDAAHAGSPPMGQAGWPWKTRVRPVRSVGLGSDGGESADRRRQQTQATNQVGLRDKRKGPETDIHVLCDLRL